MLSVLSDSSIDDAARACVDEALASGGKLLSLLSDMVLFAEGRSGADNEVVNVRNILHECVVDAERRYARPGVGVLVVFEKDVPQYLWTIPAAIRGGLSRLINNAFKFTTAGRITIAVSIGVLGSSQVDSSQAASTTFPSTVIRELSSSNHDFQSGVSSSSASFTETIQHGSHHSAFRLTLTVRIRDTGIGIPEGTIGSSIFLPFFRGTNTRTGCFRAPNAKICLRSSPSEL